MALRITIVNSKDKPPVPSGRNEPGVTHRSPSNSGRERYPSSHRISLTPDTNGVFGRTTYLLGNESATHARAYIGVLALAMILIGYTPHSSATTYFKSNGVISFNANVNSVPMISNLSILQTLVMPYDNVGAGFQFDARSSAGQAYNPTQAGDCAQTPSPLISATNNWSGNSIGLPATNGLLLSVAPRNYNDPSPCLGVGAVLPYRFDFGITLGDALHLPKEGALLEMSITRQAGGNVLEKAISSVPAIFPFAQVLPFVYWSTDGSTFQPLTNGSSNDVRTWAYGASYYRVGKLVMACTEVQTSPSSVCLALYSNKTTNVLASHRQGAVYDLSLLSLTADTAGTISDYQKHTGRKLLAVGTPSTIQAVIAQAVSVVSNWGDL